MKNIFKNSLLKMWLKKNLKNLIQVETKYGKLYLLKNDEFITGAFSSKIFLLNIRLPT